MVSSGVPPTSETAGRKGRSADLNPRGQLFWTLIITALVGLLALHNSVNPPAESAYQQTALGGLPASSLNASPVSMQPENEAR